jgi:hypothetical protein
MASMLMASWNMVQVTFTKNLYLCCLLHLTTSFLLSSEDIRPFLLSRSRQPMATLMTTPIIFYQSLGGRTIWLWGKLDMSYWHLTHPTPWLSMYIICFAFYILSCKSLKMMESDKIPSASCTYIHVLSLCHLYPLPVTWRLQMRTFKRYFSRAILLTT